MLTFQAGGSRLAVAASAVAEVVRSPKLTRVPHAPASLAGVANLRGRVAPVVSLARLLGREAQAGSGHARLIVLAGADSVALLVDEVTALRADTDAALANAAPGQLLLTNEGPARLLDLPALLAEAFGAARGPGAKADRALAQPPAAPRSVDAVRLFAFVLAGQAYALPLEHVREVIALPAEIARVSDADEALLGAAAWRGGLLPLAAARVLLGLPARPPQASDRVLAIAIGDAVVGLVVDGITAILDASEARIGPVPAVLNRGGGEAQIDAIYRPPHGAGLVSILAPEHLFRDQTTAQILTDGRRGAGMAVEADSGPGEQFVIFRLGEEEYGLPIGSVDEVVALPERLTRVPRAPAFVSGVMNLRGKVLPVIDQRRRFAVEGAASARGRRVIVVTLDGLQAGFVVDAVSEILRAPADRLRPAPELAGEAARVFDRVANLEIAARMILLVDPRALLDRAEADLLAAMTESAAPSSP